ncbi:helicase-related protein [Aquisalimonas lutea]|uniref:helicase-related protein n=1 Tax=Aquisalimonas lutea TaxID=1327750 RepID=UPI0025B4BCE0|nr:helicase-related protein [Aquisalimonas lutea]MDN3518899.1 helicase-related protein [Aquisalimonas lutea]
MTSTSSLPIDVLRDAFDEAGRHGHVVVTAATGTGKSTRLPVWAAAHGPVLVVEPRRIAATSLAARVAGELGCRHGGRVGHAVRLDSCHDDTTEILFATPGIVLNWLGAGRLAAYRTVILDEFHERRWDTDLLLALLRDAGEHSLVLTSATLDGERLAEHLDARLLEAPGSSHPVTVEHTGTSPRDMPSSRDLEQRIARDVHQVRQRTDGDVLAFLPGRREIAGTARRLASEDADVVCLHGSAPVADQKRALHPGDRQRVILATNVAESSLTVPGVTAVVDSGLERRTLQRNGRTVLALQPVSRASAEQRKGRAGRTAPGLCLRLWGGQAPLQASTPPETRREDLTDLTLAAAVAGRPVRALQFPDPPREESLSRAERYLRALGAIDADGRATATGQRLFALPVDTAFAALILAMPDAEAGGFMADLAAALTTGRGLVHPSGEEDARAELTEALGRRCDATLLVAALRGTRLPGVTVADGPRREALRLAAQVRSLAQLPAVPATLATGTADRALAAAAAAAPAMVFVRREKRRQALANGRAELVPGRQTLFGADDEAALVLDDHSVPGRGTRETVTVATCMAPLAPETLITWELARPGDDNPAVRDGRLVCQRAWRYAGRVLHREEVEPEGAAAREAAAALILQDRLLAPAGARLRDDIEAWTLYQELHGYNEPVPEPHAWLVERLAALGVGHGDDLALIEPPDLRFEGIPAWERERFDERYPRRWSLPGVELRIHYDVHRKRVTAEPMDGSGQRQPKRWELPAWPGWRVRFRKASREVDIR